MRYAFILCVALAGCALTPEQASKMSNYDLCQRIYIGNNAESRNVAAAEMVDRRMSCEPYRDMIVTNAQIRAQNNAAIGAAGAQILNQQNQNRQNAYQAAPRQQNCHWTRLGGDWIQNCQ